MAKLYPYIFSDDARKQAEFYVKALGGEIVSQQTFGEMPGAAEEDKDRVMHLVLQAAGLTFYMADNGANPVIHGNGLQLTLEYPQEEEARKAFEALASEGGRVVMPFQKMFWGTMFGMVEDPFGMKWQVVTEG